MTTTTRHEHDNHDHDTAATTRRRRFACGAGDSARRRRRRRACPLFSLHLTSAHLAVFLTGAWKRHGSATSTLSRRRSLGPCGLAPACRRSVYVCTPSHHLVHDVYVYINVYDERYRYSATLLFRVFHHHRAIRRFPSFRPCCHSPRRSRANLSSFLSLFPLFPLAWLLCRYTDSHASVASVSPRQSTVSPLSFLSLSLSLNLFYSIFLPAHYTATSDRTFRVLSISFDMYTE